LGRPVYTYTKVKHYTRREALERLSPAVLLSLGLWPGALSAAPSGGSFRFIVVNDLHYVNAACGQWLEKMTRQMKGHGDIELCLVAGDQTEHGQPEHHGAVHEVLRAFGIPTYVVIGNHDYVAGSGERSAYDKIFPRSLNYSFVHRSWQFVGLDTSEGLKYENTSIQPHTFQWVHEQVRKLDKKGPTIIFTHFPLGPGVKYRPVNADLLLESFKPLNLQAIFCGHYHGFTETKIANTIATTNRCCALKRGNHDGTKEKGYFLCTARDGKVTREFVELAPDKQATK
jgi:3',5'-cyclic AMP phosphodiesterase CpdA